MEKELYRALDANLNRAREGLRVLEDVARFSLNDIALAARARKIRHEFLSVMDQHYPLLLAARDVGTDFGAEYAASRHQDEKALMVANVRRVQEAARVLEETARYLRPEAADSFKKLRFAAYELEQAFSIRFIRMEKVQTLEQLRLYVILGTAHTLSRPVLDVAREAIRGGAGMVQLREKDLPAREFLRLAHSLRELTRNAGIPLIINDRVDIAATTGADGVHLGQDDLPVSAARRLLGEHAIIGVSTHSIHEAVAAEQNGADYIGFGPVFPTATKPDLKAKGTALLQEVSKTVSIPVVAVGGISPENIAEIVAVGVRRVAVVSAVAGVPQVAEAARFLRKLLEG